MKTANLFTLMVLAWSLLLFFWSNSLILSEEGGKRQVIGLKVGDNDKEKTVTSSLTTTNTTNNNKTGIAGRTTFGTLIIKVRGEMGNHLQKIAHGYGLLWYAMELQEPVMGLHPTLKIQHAMHKNKWRKAQADVQQCFTNLRTLDYESAHQPAFNKLKRKQENWWKQSKTRKDEYQHMLDHVRGEGLSQIQQGMKEWKQLQQVLPGQFSRETEPSSSSSINQPLHSPFPMVQLGGPMRNALIDHFYDKYRSLFAWDLEHGGEDCCKQMPDSDEVVFHFRNFARELSVEEQTSCGFEELDPQRTVSQLLGHLAQGQKIAITTRFEQDPLVQTYRNAMEEQRFRVRLVTNQTGVQDFCFLLHAQQELIGVAKSTYARWAAYLGKANKVQLYALNNTGSREFIRNVMEYPWKNPEITRRIQWPVFASSYPKS